MYNHPFILCFGFVLQGFAVFLLLGGKGELPCSLFGFEDFGKHRTLITLVSLISLIYGAVGDTALAVVGVLVGEEAQVSPRIATEELLLVAPEGSITTLPR